MKALSLKQPWANWIVQGRKTIETRTWSTPYRGPLLICSSKSVDLAALYRMGGCPDPKGVALATCRLVNVRPMEAKDEGAAMCACEIGRFAWDLIDIRPIEKPFPVRGQLGIFEVNHLAIEAPCSRP